MEYTHTKDYFIIYTNENKLVVFSIANSGSKTNTPHNFFEGTKIQCITELINVGIVDFEVPINIQKPEIIWLKFISNLPVRQFRGNRLMMQ